MHLMGAFVTEGWEQEGSGLEYRIAHERGFNQRGNSKYVPSHGWDARLGSPSASPLD